MAATRITAVQLAELAQRVSKQLRGDLFVVVAGRYGYTAVDLYDKRGMVRTLSSGLSKRQAHDYLSAMYEALYIVGRDA